MICVVLIAAFFLNGRLTLQTDTVNPIIIENCTINEWCKNTTDNSAMHIYLIKFNRTNSQNIKVISAIEYDINSTQMPVLFTAKGATGLQSWSLPITFKSGLKYTLATNILCPYSKNSMYDLDHVLLEVSTTNPSPIPYNFSVLTFDMELQKLQPLEVIVSPTNPALFRYTFESSAERIFFTASSPDRICSRLSFQSFDCVMSDALRISNTDGQYQTMTKQGAFTIDGNDRTSDVLYFILTVDDMDTNCFGPDAFLPLIPAKLVDVPRNKNVTFFIQTSNSRVKDIIAVTLPAIFFLSIWVITFISWCFTKKSIQDDISRLTAEEHHIFREEQRTDDDEECILPSNLQQESSSTGPFADREGRPALPVSTSAFVSVADLSIKSESYLERKFIVYSQITAAIAIFYALPVAQLVLQYQFDLSKTGDNDICYFNFLCTRKLAFFSAFNNIYSNIGYCALGILFLIVVRRRDVQYQHLKAKHPFIFKEFGLPLHFGLYYAMGIGLFMEGIMSACYHVCPSKSNFQFDTSFMYVVAVLTMLKIYETRHPDINPHAYSTFTFLAAIIFVEVLGAYISIPFFWIIFAVLHSVFCVLWIAKIYYMGRLKIGLAMPKNLWMLLNERGLFSRPRHIDRMILIMIAGAANIGFAVFRAINRPSNFPNHLVVIFLGNLVLYFLWYIIMKLHYREKFSKASKLCIGFSSILWSLAFYFFFQELKSWEISPAISREHNKGCTFLSFYDVHDCWHFLSALAIYFSFVGLLTLDDKLQLTLRSNIPVF